VTNTESQNELVAWRLSLLHSCDWEYHHGMWECRRAVGRGFQPASRADVCATIRELLTDKHGNIQVQYSSTGYVAIRRWTDASQWNDCIGDGQGELVAHIAAFLAMFPLEKTA